METESKIDEVETEFNIGEAEAVSNIGEAEVESEFTMRKWNLRTKRTVVASRLKQKY